MKTPRVELYEQVIAKYGAEKQTDKAIEELAELTAAIQKYRDGRVPLAAVVDEMADVHIMLEQLTLILKLGTDDVYVAKMRKLARLQRKLRGDVDET